MARLQPPLTGYKQASLQIEGQGPINCWFNPKEYTIQKQNQWRVDPVVGTALPTAQFGGGQPRKLSLTLLFDSTDRTDLDVGKITGRLLSMMEVNEGLDGSGKNRGRPPMVTFTWGATGTFKAVADSLNIQYTLFRSDGLPIRAQAQLSLIQVEKARDGSSGGGNSRRPGNPTTRAVPGIGAHVVRDGDSLPSIAFLHYRDPTRWRVIAEANQIDDPLRLRRGRTLSIPRLEQ